MRRTRTTAAWSVPLLALRDFRLFSWVGEMCMVNISEKCNRFWAKNDIPFFCFSFVFASWKKSWLCDAISRYILLIGTNGSYACFFAKHLKGLAWLCVWPDPKVIFFVWLFRILTGPGFCMRFILQNPGWVWGKWGPLWLLSGWVICGSYVGQIQANVPVDSAGHMPQPQFY